MDSESFDVDPAAGTILYGLNTTQCHGSLKLKAGWYICMIVVNLFHETASTSSTQNDLTRLRIPGWSLTYKMSAAAGI